MLDTTIRPTGRAVTFGQDEIIVSKTDTRGRITYANRVFLRVADYPEHEVIGQPHSLIRHPDMPRCVFKLLWDTIASGHEIFAYVKNMARSGDHYWVFAHVTPTFDTNGVIVGYHSNRRLPDPGAVAKIEPVYASLRTLEEENPDRKAGMNEAYQRLVAMLRDQGVDYDAFVFSL